MTWAAVMAGVVLLIGVSLAAFAAYMVGYAFGEADAREKFAKVLANLSVLFIPAQDQKQSEKPIEPERKH